MKHKLNSAAIAVFAGLLISQQANATELFKNDTTSVATRGYLRLSYYNTDDTDEITDSGSRWGLTFNHKIEGDWTAGLTTEWATNFEKNANLTVGGDRSTPQGSSGDALTSRLGYIHLNHDKWGSIGVGKQWAVFYDIVAGTDILNFWGGNASGAYNLGTDGGLSGTGRAEQAITWRKTYNNLSIGLQLQAQDEELKAKDHAFVPDDITLATLGNSYGVGLIYNWNKLAIGVAHNASDIDIAPALSILNISDPEDKISAVSLTYGSVSEGFYGSVNAVTSEWHETDNEGQYIDAVGSELYLKYSLGSDWGFFAGFNHLESDQSNSKYEMHYNFAGVEYYFENGFGSLFIEGKMHDDVDRDGTDGYDDSELVIGVKVNL